MERFRQYCCRPYKSERTRHTVPFPVIRSTNGLGLQRQPVLPLKISQSPCDVAMKSNIGKDSQVFVREAMNAWRASSGAAGGPPCSAPIIRLLFGQIIPQTFSNMIKPIAPPTPIESVLLLAL